MVGRTPARRCGDNAMPTLPGAPGRGMALRGAGRRRPRGGMPGGRLRGRAHVGGARTSLPEPGSELVPAPGEPMASGVLGFPGGGPRGPPGGGARLGGPAASSAAAGDALELLGGASFLAGGGARLGGGAAAQGGRGGGTAR
jgi:translation initiation factor IF-2